MEATGRAALNQALTALARGERAAGDAVFRLLWPVLRTFAVRWLDGAAGSEDVAQQVLIRVFEQAPAFDPSRDALAWALEIAVWECRTERKRRARSREGGWSPAAEGVAGAGRPDEAVEARELTEALRAALASLPEADREALERSLAGGAAAGATERKRKQRALDRLRGLWRGLHGAE